MRARDCNSQTDKKTDEYHPTATQGHRLFVNFTLRRLRTINDAEPPHDDVNNRSHQDSQDESGEEIGEIHSGGI